MPLTPLLADSAKQKLVTLDLEGVLAPEIWLAVADRFELDDMRMTTRDDPDYRKLMMQRIGVLTRHDIRFSQIVEVVSGLVPLPGAVAFLDRLRCQVPVVVLSDTFEQLAAPIFASLGQPVTLCHRLCIEDDRIVDIMLRHEDPKRAAVQAFQSLNYEVIAVGDSYNDLSMLEAAEIGCLIHPPDSLRGTHPHLGLVEDLSELATWLGLTTETWADDEGAQPALNSRP